MMLNFLLTIVYGYWLVVALLLFFIGQELWRGRTAKKIKRGRRAATPETRLAQIWVKLNSNLFNFDGKNKKWGYLTAGLLILGLIISLDARFIEVNIIRKKKIEIALSNLSQPLKIALITDIQVGAYKRSAWVEKIVTKVEQINPDLIILGGDLIDNEGNPLDETIYLKPLYRLVKKYPIYYLLGNHEYGIGSRTIYSPFYRTGDRSQDLINRMKEIGIPLLRNTLACPEIDGGKICLFGLDDIWADNLDFKELKNWDKSTPLLLLSHNPDGIIYWPQNIAPPALELAGHTHGGQIYLPFWGPLGNAELTLPKKFYRGLNYYHDIPVFTSLGIGESGAPLRLFTPAEIAVVSLMPKR